MTKVANKLLDLVRRSGLVDEAKLTSFLERARRAHGEAVIEDQNRLAELLIEAGAGRFRPDSKIDHGVSLEMRARLGDEVREGDELARIWLRRDDDRLAGRFEDCFEVGEEGTAPELILEAIRTNTD